MDNGSNQKRGADLAATVTEDEKKVLSAAEQYALALFRRDKNNVDSRSASVAEVKALEFYALFRNGRTIAEIRKLNPEYTLGQIVDAAVTGNWFERKASEIQDLPRQAMERAIATQFESIKFVSDLISAQHRKFAGAIERAIQTGDLSGLDQFSLRTYKEALGLLREITGQSGNPKGGPPMATPQADGSPPTVAEAVVVGGEQNPLTLWASQKKLGEKK